jgi:carbonic anhydrase/acetyltransferase-like protein (isoleucine patch superfamily)
MAHIVEFAGKRPKIAENVFFAETAALIGDVEIADGCSIWFGAVLRADFAPIRVGRMCNIQDNVVAHADARQDGLLLEEGVTVGHSAILHGSRIGAGCLIGMGSILLSGSVIGARSMLAAGTVVREGQVIPADCLAAGNPAVVKGPLTGEAARWASTGAQDYWQLAQHYRLR